MVTNKIVVAVVSAMMLLAIAPTALAFTKTSAAAAGLTISVGSNYYRPGETVSLTGTAGVNATVSVSVENVKETVYTGSATPNANGTYSVSFTLAADAYQGEYEAKATDGTNEAKTVFVVSTVSLQDLAQGGLALVKDAKARCEAFFNRTEAANGTVSASARQHYEKGVAKLNEAQTLLSAGKPWEAIKAEYTAMSEFKKAMSVGSGDQDEDEAEGVEDDFAEDLAEFDERIQRLNATLVDLAGSGKNVTAARAALESAKVRLAEAKSLLDAGKTVEAKTVLEAAQTAISQVRAEIRKIDPKLGQGASGEQSEGKEQGSRHNGQKDDGEKDD